MLNNCLFLIKPECFFQFGEDVIYDVPIQDKNAIPCIEESDN